MVTLLERAPVERPSCIEGRVVLEPASPIVWFTFPDAWHDVGRFHRSDGTFTGWYANVLTPVEGIAGREWRTTDLFLDVWLPADAGTARILDEDELAEAVVRGWVTEDTARIARLEAERLVLEAAAENWPPAVTRRWTLERARAELGHPGSNGV